MKRLKLFESCQAVKGFTRSILYDLESCKYHFIPNLLYNIINNFDKKYVSDIYNNYTDVGKEIIDEYIEYLKSNNFCFFCDDNDIDRFLPLSKEWDSPSRITNAIIELGIDSTKTKLLFKQLEALICKHILIICKNDSDFFNHKIDEILENGIIMSVTLWIPYNSNDNKTIIEILAKNVRVKNIILHSAETNELLFSNEILGQKAIKIKNSINTCSIDYNNFKINSLLFNESQLHNTCLNRKVCIDKDGNIKNCLSMEETFGNINNITLEEVIVKDTFQSKWFINKDRIDVCKDCEFRHMCTDCRCFIKDSENLYSQPSKCAYNPYICKWSWEEDYIPVEECGSYSKETGFVPNKKRIEELNLKIWGE